MKIFKKLQVAFGGCALYIDKRMLDHLKVHKGDEVSVELVEGKIIITKPLLSSRQIEEILSAKRELNKGI